MQATDATRLRANRTQHVRKGPGLAELAENPRLPCLLGARSESDGSSKSDARVPYVCKKAPRKFVAIGAAPLQSER